MKTKPILLMIACLCVCPFTYAQSCDSLKSIDWLLGDWRADHDIPKKLEYRLDDENSLTVNVSDGGDKGFSINFVRPDN